MDDPHFGALCLLAARGVEVSDHALVGAVMEWNSHRTQRLIGSLFKQK